MSPVSKPTSKPTKTAAKRVFVYSLSDGAHFYVADSWKVDSSMCLHVLVDGCPVATYQTWHSVGYETEANR